MIVPKSTMFHPLSPFVHPSKVKEVGVANCSYIDKNNFSLYMFHPFTRTSPRDAYTRVFACVREGVGEEGKQETDAFVSAGWRTHNQTEKEKT